MLRVKKETIEKLKQRKAQEIAFFLFLFFIFRNFGSLMAQSE